MVQCMMVILVSSASDSSLVLLLFLAMFRVSLRLFSIVEQCRATCQDARAITFTAVIDEIPKNSLEEEGNDGARGEKNQCEFSLIILTEYEYDYNRDADC
mmetsp:Transcript_25683/g.41250  ORF Transcript_25683/g.41250 Transcript_25683/m.41250 type:complete len:100 (-) Transcript_25683:669-968(-)